MPIKKLKKEKYVKYHNDGSLWARGTLIDGKMEGLWVWFRKPASRGGEKGSKMRSGYFKNGKQTGDWTTYNSKGKVVKVTKFK